MRRSTFLNGLVVLLVAPIRAFARDATITNLDPASGRPGDTVRITGKGLGATSSVTFNGTSATFDVSNSRSVYAVVPAEVTTGPVSLTSGRFTTTSPYPFTVEASPPSDGPAQYTSGPLEP